MGNSMGSETQQTAESTTESATTAEAPALDEQPSNNTVADGTSAGGKAAVPRVDEKGSRSLPSSPIPDAFGLGLRQRYGYTVGDHVCEVETEDPDYFLADCFNEHLVSLRKLGKFQLTKGCC